MTITLRQAIDKTLSRVQLAAGPDVQVYAENQIKEIIQHKFDVLFDEIWWPQYFTAGEVFTLDGSTGKVVQDISAKIKRYEDIKHVWIDSYPTPIGRISGRVNPNIITSWSYAPTSGPKVFVVYPVNTSGSITVSYRTKPDSLDSSDDTIDIDEHLIILGAAYDYLNSLGYNTAAEDKLLTLFNERFDQLRKQVEQVETSIDPAYGVSANGWQDAPW
jgi:hypothetical protein